jgi:hypothetical protein
VQIGTQRRCGFARPGPLSELDVFFQRQTEKFTERWMGELYGSSILICVEEMVPTAACCDR